MLNIHQIRDPLWEISAPIFINKLLIPISFVISIFKYNFIVQAVQSLTQHHFILKCTNFYLFIFY